MPAGKLSNRLVQPGLTAVVGGGAAAPVESGITATGGTIGTYTANNETYRFHVFNSSGTFTISAIGSVYNSVELLIAGGGQGAGNSGETLNFGGAGAAVRYYGSEPKANTGMTATGAAITTMGVASYTVTVGAGGAATGASGTASSFVGGSFNLSSPSGFSTTSGNGSSKTSHNNANFRGGTSTDSTAGAGGAGCAGPGDGLNFRSFDGATPARPGNGGNGIWLGLTGIPLGFGGGGAGGKTGYGASDALFTASGGAGAGDAGVASRVNSGAGGSSTWDGSSRFAGASGCVIIRYRIY
jgi:hypothetical protein